MAASRKASGPSSKVIRAVHAPWLVLAAWLGLMMGVGAALRPEAPRVLAANDADVLASAWGPTLAASGLGRPALFIGNTACPCDGDAPHRLATWAQSVGIDVREAPGLPGIALASNDGSLRYAGEASALVSHCGGARGFQAWWEGDSRPVLTVPCPCEN